MQPGDFVTYYARARDVNRGRRSTEARSDIFFLEVKPFEEEFVAAQSQSMGQGSAGKAAALQGLAEAQKQIIVATWKLDARARRARDAGSQRDIKAVAKAQIRTARSRGKGERAGRAARVATRGDVAGRIERRPATIRSAAPSKRWAARSTSSTRSTPRRALPHEMEALNQLLRAEAENRRREVTRQQQAAVAAA